LRELNPDFAMLLIINVLYFLNCGIASGFLRFPQFFLPALLCRVAHFFLHSFFAHLSIDNQQCKLKNGRNSCSLLAHFFPDILRDCGITEIVVHLVSHLSGLMVPVVKSGYYLQQNQCQI
jgi:hypothetical protein